MRNSAIFLETFIRLLLSDTKMVYGELVLKGFVVSVQNHLNLLNQLHNAISFLNFGLFFLSGITIIPISQKVKYQIAENCYMILI
ncbi:MAG: hypothetical protein EGQ87_04030 [Clostridiales bacterium]|nr:hypothetical protein [Clostridiales bacterium]